MAFSLAKKINYTYGIACAHDILGTIYRFQNSDVDALEHYLKANQLYQEQKDSLLTAQTYNNIGQIYQTNKEHDKSLDAYMKSYDLYKKINDDVGIAIMLNNIGIVYLNKNQDSLALQYYNQAYEMNEKIDRKRGMGYASMNIGNIYLRKDLYDKAKYYYLISLSNFLDIDDPKGLAISYYNVGNCYEYLIQYDSAEVFLLKSKELATKYNFLAEIKTSLAGLIEMSKSQGKYIEAFNYQEAYIEIQDTLLQIRTKETIDDLERRNEFEKAMKEHKFELLEKSKELKISSLQIYILLITLISVSVIALILINKKKIKIKFYNEELSIKNNELVDLAIYILQKNDLIHSFRKELQQLQKRLKVEENKKSVEEIINSLIFKIAISKDIEKFRDNLRELSEEFFTKLELKFPGLTEKEKQLATLLRLNLSSKQIAIILGISSDSVDMNRYRLRKKIGLNSGDNLLEYFSKI